MAYVLIVFGLLLGFWLRWLIQLAITFIFSLRYAPVDLFTYFFKRGWKQWRGFGLRIYVGLFGTGKSLSAVRYVTRNAKKYNLNVISNIKLFDVPYTPLINYQQIIDAPGDTIILIDEVSTVFNARSWKDFNVNLLFQLLQCRKQRKQLVCTAQRFLHVDKLLRDITAQVIVCRKKWRVCTNVSYDGWDFENAPANTFINPLWKQAYVSSNKLYAAYDTDEVIDNAKKTDFISNAAILTARDPQQVIPDKVNRKGRKFFYKKG